MLVNLCNEIGTKGNLRKLAVTGLNVSNNKVTTALTNHSNDLSEAAHEVLQHWNQDYLDKREAYTVLWEALQMVGLGGCIIALK